MVGNVGMWVDHHTVAAARVRHQRAGVALHARGDEQRGLLAQTLGGVGLEFVQGGVVVEYVVAHDSGSHRVAHCLRRLGDRITPQINIPHDKTTSVI